MDYVIIIVVAFGASMLTFFSGFGLGTLLTPAFLLFFPLPIAISLTAAVHFLNNSFKFALIGKHVDKKTLLGFGIPAIIGVFPGVYLLSFLDNIDTILNYSLFSNEYTISWLGVIMGLLMIFFALNEFSKIKPSKPSKVALAGGGFLSGFFGGLSGHQGALRSSFLIRLNLSKEAFVATGVAISLFVDITRIPMYFSSWMSELDSSQWLLVVLAVVPAFIGAYFGKKWLKKTSILFVRRTVGWMLIIFGILLIGGILS
jgi:uncharacterized membrane protein YfcA